MDQLFWFRVFFNGGAIAVALLCIALTFQKQARGAIKLILWIVALSVLLIQAGCWFLGQRVGRAIEG
jgi:phosphate/sulfate permease